MVTKQFTRSSHLGLLVTVLTSGKRKLKFAVGLGTKRKSKEKSGGPGLRLCCGRGTWPAHCISLGSAFLICKTGCPEGSEGDSARAPAHSVWHLINSKSEASGLSMALPTYGESVLAAVHRENESRSDAP